MCRVFNKYLSLGAAEGIRYRYLIRTLYLSTGNTRRKAPPRHPHLKQLCGCVLIHIGLDLGTVTVNDDVKVLELGVAVVVKDDVAAFNDLNHYTILLSNSAVA